MIGSYSLPLPIKGFGDTVRVARGLVAIISQPSQRLLRTWFGTQNCRPPSFLIFQLAISCNLSVLFLCGCIMTDWQPHPDVCLLFYAKGLQRDETNISHFVLTRMTSPLSALCAAVDFDGMDYFHLYGCLVVLMYLLERNLSHTSVSGCGRWLQK